MHVRRDVQRVAERAFWDALEHGLRAAPPQWERLVVLLGEAREALADIIPEASQEGRRLRNSLAEKLDLVSSDSSASPPPSLGKTLQCRCSMSAADNWHF